VGSAGGRAWASSIVHAIVADAGGAIDVRSVVSEGSRFTIYLPLAGIATQGVLHE
jgi:signal transduction histidine kinase